MNGAQTGRLVEKYQPIKSPQVFVEAFLLFRWYSGSQDNAISNPECCLVAEIAEKPQ
jgi:hypothetical protein